MCIKCRIECEVEISYTIRSLKMHNECVLGSAYSLAFFCLELLSYFVEDHALESPLSPLLSSGPIALYLGHT